MLGRQVVVVAAVAATTAAAAAAAVVDLELVSGGANGGGDVAKVDCRTNPWRLVVFPCVIRLPFEPILVNQSMNVDSSNV